MQYGHHWLEEYYNSAAKTPLAGTCCSSCHEGSRESTADSEFASIRLLKRMVLEAQVIGLGISRTSKQD
jgi:hypothetical protein